MLVKTRHFGEIDLTEDKILTFDNGILGFENYKKYAILFNNENAKEPTISWLQSLEEETLAIPVINPLLVKENYDPIVEDEWLKSLGGLEDENMLVLLTMTIPSNLENMTVNLKAPFIINSNTKKGCQIIVENKDYEVRYNVYNILKKKRGNSDVSPF